MCSPCHIRSASNLEIVIELDCLFTFFIFCCVKKKKESLWNIFFSNHETFSISWSLEGALKLISQEQFKNTTTKIFQVRRKFQGSTRIEYDMKSTLVEPAAHASVSHFKLDTQLFWLEILTANNQNVRLCRAKLSWGWATSVKSWVQLNYVPG